MPTPDRPHIDFVFFDAGGGHRSAANALKAVIDQQQRPWNLRLVNLQEVLDSLDIFRKYTRIRMEDVYNKLLAKGWTLGSEQLLVVMHLLIRMYHKGQVRLLTEFWKQNKPDLVVSLVPNFNRAMYQALQKVDPSIPYCTILTDFADFPPHFWIESGQQQHFICGTKRAMEHARAAGHADERLFATSGMILRPRFYEVPPIDVAAERIRQGLKPNLPTGVILFGGQGSPVMRTLAKRLQECPVEHQLIFLCGRNEKLARQITELDLKYPRLIVTFTENVPYYMQLADFFIGKPGPGSISEAVAMGLPVILEKNSWTLPQERYNAEWVEENRVGIVLNNFNQIGDGLSRLLSGTVLSEYRNNAKAIENRAIFEIPEILSRLLARGDPNQDSQATHGADNAG